MGKKAKKIQNLYVKIEETKALLEELQEEVVQLEEERQHKRVDKLEKALVKSSDKESLPELSTEAMKELGTMLGKMMETVQFWKKEDEK